MVVRNCAAKEKIMEDVSEISQCIQGLGSWLNLVPVEVKNLKAYLLVRVERSIAFS